MFLVAVFLGLILFAKVALAQCSMCRDATAGSAPRARSGLRIAIPVLGIPALLVFSGLVVFALKRDKANKQN